MDIKKFRKLPVMGILRDIPLRALEPLIETVIDSGLETIEIALNSEGAIELIKKAVKISRERLTIGAGTVLNRRDAQKACKLGAEFIVTPVLVSEVSVYCRENKIPFFPGALTPREIYMAWQSVPSMVKVFPASVVGPRYFKEVKGPFKEIELMAVGGVTSENVEEYFSNGASAIAFGASIFRKEWINNNDFSSLRNCLDKLIKQVKEICR